MLRLVGDGEGESGYVSDPSGLRRAGLTTSHRIQSHQLSVSLNDLEREVQILESKYLEACVTLIIATHRLAELGNFIKDIITTEGEKDV